MPAEYSKLFGNIDNAVASFLFDAPVDATQPKIADVLTGKPTSSREGKSFLNLRMPAEYSKLFGNIDNAVASFLFDAPIDVTQPKIADVLTTQKQRSRILEDFRDKLYGVNS
jgi:hypothetical protein